MQRVALVVSCAAVLAAAAAVVAGEEKKEAAGVASMAWLAGEWTSDEGGTAFDEHWLAPRGDSMFAVSRMVEGGKTGMIELSSIEDAADGTWLRIRHYGRALEPWKMDAAGPLAMKLVESGERKAVFEDAKREFPKRLVYSREGDVLTARLEGKQGGKPADEEFKLKLAAKR
jgi:hypothetical protein